MDIALSPKRLAKSAAASLLGLGLALPLGLPAANSLTAVENHKAFQQAAASASQEVLTEAMKEAEGEISVFVQFRGAGAYESTQPA
ncbi:MAG: hypothetical protein Q3965_02595, partial [Rothia sp. (in: high G+C Gram-positive bacteria)]|nr:hypothetical protein [Rothia sp. (in: high G+C Gram-positive bacteria)]